MRSCRPALVLLAALLAALPFAQADPPPAASNATGNATANPLVNCHDVSTGVDAGCWAQLNMSSWVLDWYNSHTCHPTEPFSTCFLRLNHAPDVDCTVINSQSCGATISDNIDNPQVFYVLHNIYAINNFFNSWQSATAQAFGDSSDTINSIVQLIDPPVDSNVMLQNVLTYVLFAVALIPGPISIIAGEAEIGVQLAIATAGTLSLTTPGLFKYVFPKTTDDTRPVLISQLSQSLESLKNGITGRLQPILSVAESNVTSFIQMAAGGTFSTHPPPALDSQVGALRTVFNTFVVSSALNASQYTGVQALNTNVQQLATNGTALSYDISCDTYEKPYNICNAWWYDDVNDRTWTLIDGKNVRNNPYKILSSVFANGWTSGAALFENAAFCKSSGHQPSDVEFSVDQGMFSLQCVSQLSTCTWDPTCHAQALGYKPGTCEFTDCPTMPGFAPHLGRFSSWFQVPAGYLGPLMWARDITVRNN
ncbi:MAG: hypothetical protein M1838_003100 [Thelocarpon superellum]|nr:MAG: hypothetical protein M1838_003100 [Thelocarpon superellum]